MKREKFFKILKYILFSILIMFLVLSLHFIRVYQIRAFKVTSGSMESTIPQDAIVITVKTNNYAVGDIVSFKNIYNEVVTHRIVDINNHEFFTKGDANMFNDNEVVLNEAIVGKVITVISNSDLIFNQNRLWYTFYIPTGFALGICLRRCIISPIAPKQT